MTDPLRHFREVWLVDFEFHQPPGERPTPICLVAREYRSGRLCRRWLDGLAANRPPFDAGAGNLVVSYFASAELSCFLSLGWAVPVRVLDLFTEFRVATNGRETPCGNSLLGALTAYGLGGIGVAEKTELRELAMRGGPFTFDERQALLDYCQSDVDALAKLLPAMIAEIDLPRALLRGRYMTAVARMEACGVPVDVGLLDALRANWEAIKARLVERVDADYGVYDGTTFKRDRFADWLIRKGIPWPRTETGQLSLADDAFRQMARQFPAVAPLRELRHALSELRLESLAVGSDGRNRCMLSPFRATSGRNAPSNTRFVFGPSCWLRGLIRPESDRAVAYVDWSQQEFGIAAALSADVGMRKAYESADPYLTFAKQAGAVPPDATRETHSPVREQFKICSLAVQYGMGPQSLAESIGEPTCRGRELLGLHRAAYPRFWKWSHSAVDHALLRGWLETVFGWRVRLGRRVNPRSLANFPMQVNGAEMLRLACCLATERGVEVCCPVHDAVLVEGPAESIDDVVRSTRAAMAEASRAVLDGFELKTDAVVVQWPDRYMDPRGKRMYEAVTALLRETEHTAGDPTGATPFTRRVLPPPSNLISCSCS